LVSQVIGAFWTERKGHLQFLSLPFTFLYRNCVSYLCLGEALMKENDSISGEHNKDLGMIIERAIAKAAKESFEKGLNKVDAVRLQSAKEVFEKAVSAIDAAEAAIQEGEETIDFIECIGIAESFKEKAKW
jgi:hypothetical protein